MLDTAVIYKKIKNEAERFYVSKFVDSPKLEKLYKESSRHVLDNDEPKGVINFNSKYGQGKTFFFNVLYSACKRELNVNIFKKTSAKELIEVYSNGGETKLLEFISCKNLFIDDIGDELDGGDGTTKNYGNKLNVIKFTLLKRYEFWEAKGWKTHATTNISLEKMAINYGGRVADRLAQMCTVLDYDLIKTSFRQVTTIKQLTQSEKDANELKYYPKKIEGIERVDMILFLNDLIEDPEEDTRAKDIYYFTFIREYLERNKKITYTEISDADINAAELLARQTIRKATIYKNIYEGAANKQKQEKYGELSFKNLMLLAKNAQVRNLILDMKATGLKF